MSDLRKESIEPEKERFFYGCYCCFFFSLVNYQAMRERYPTKAVACSSGGKLFFTERWIAAVVVEDAQVEINHYINVLNKKQKRSYCRGRASVRKCTSVKEFGNDSSILSDELGQIRRQFSCATAQI